MPGNALKNFLAEATETYYQALRGSPAVEYLESRNLSGGSAQRFKLGYVAEPLTGHDMFKGRLCIPYLTRAGTTLLKFRDIAQDSGAKYLYQPGSVAKRIFNPGALFGSTPFVAVCEGEIDAIVAEQCGIPAVGIAGVDNWEPYFARVFSGYERVLILADSDDKGQGAEFAESLARFIPSARIVNMPEGHDVNSFVSMFGEGALLERVGLL